MGELAELTPAKPTLVAGSRPRAIVPTDIEQVWRMAEIVYKSGLAPHDLDTKEKITVALLHGLEIGLPPMLALNKIAIVNGRPSVWGDAVPGVALGTGLLEDWQERIDGEGDHMVASCTVKRKGVKTAKTETFSVADAKTAGLWDERQKIKRRNKKTGEFFEGENDSPWHRYPKRMLKMRARVAFRDMFADAFGGLLIAEELIGAQEPLSLPDAPTAPSTLMLEAVSTTVVGETTPQDEPERDDISTTGKPLPPLVKTAHATKEPKSISVTIDFVAFRKKLDASRSMDEANSIYDDWISKRPQDAPLSSDQQDEADAIMREVCARGWAGE